MKLPWFQRRKDFFGLLEGHAAKMAEGLTALSEFIADPSDARAERVVALEDEADELRRQTMVEVDQAFVTPIDREDIAHLAAAVDEVINYAKTTVEEMRLFGVQSNRYLQQMSSELAKAAGELSAAIGSLRKRPGETLEHVTKVRKLENFIEHIYREALVELFKDEDVKKILATREVYRHLSNAADRADAAAGLLGDIVVKIT